MTAPQLRRLVATGLVAAFPAGVADLPGAAGCPHHDGTGRSGGSVASHGPASVVHLAHGAHGVPPEPVPPEPGPPEWGPPAEGPDEAPSLCTCIGDCHAGGAAAPLDGESTLRVADDVRPLREPRPAREHVPGPVAYLLPYANAPPQA